MCPSVGLARHSSDVAANWPLPWHTVPVDELEGLLEDEDPNAISVPLQPELHLGKFPPGPMGAKPCKTLR